MQAARLAAGLTQQELCEQASISYSTLAKIERGAIKSPSIFTIGQICQILGVSVEGLLSTAPQAIKTRARTGVEKHERPDEPITFIYCDINGVMVRFYQRAFAALAHSTNQPLDLVEQVFWRYNDPICSGEMTEVELNKILAETLEVPSVNWREYYINAVEPIVEFHTYITQLVSRYKIGLISNIFPGFIDALTDANKLPDIPYVSVVDSSEQHVIKPHREIYEIAERLAGAKAGQILLIDDTRANIIAAQQLGWRCIWFDSYHPNESIQDIERVLSF